MADSASPRLRTTLYRIALVVLLAWFAWSDWQWRGVLDVQPLGIDFGPLWAGGRTALSAPARLYDFDFISALQGWPLGRASPRPFVYPPSALLVFAPLSLLPYWTSYAVWMGGTGLAFWWAGVKAQAPWWFVLMPWVVFCVVCGQATFLLGALIVGGLACSERPILGGVLFGLAAAMKPQLLVFLPIALAAERRWRMVAATAIAGLAVCAASLAIWGMRPWIDWIAALPRFQAVVFAKPALVRNAVTPYAALVQHGLPGAWAFALAPLAALWVWLAFRRRTDLADRLIALVGAALMVSPYAMNYEMALFAPASATLLARTRDGRWPFYGASAWAQSRSFGIGLLTLLPALAQPLLRRLDPPGASSNPNS